MLFYCCQKEELVRVTLLGPDTKSTTTIYTKLTNTTKPTNTHARHLETLVTLNSLKVSLCNVECHDKELWTLNMKFSDGVIFVVNVDEEKLEIDKILRDKNEKHVILVLCNTKNIGDYEVSKDGWGERVKVTPCNVEEWKGVEEGLAWMTGMLKGKQK